ncbi:hypothetical protein DTO96_101175 [Ephemeroptericola cinctiostellae]|uniref:Activator of Hsp90 ATPase homologue 1/2-like C-terminal domain-containing protein n=1 Tax=Ephemeroptericola cinctiostellae TaxID=2268024 RepID=A0A345DAQ6_9BURK|nr:SRPBCC domain-containing protein [Ephemeroptericola cinctiostellae]AXF85444.1 hypothetical protein DTO96_101175 [Ephemeroptericola cinctiostellae]
MTTFSTSRQLAASPSLVFGAMKDAERLAKWWGPAGFSNRFDVFEFKTGGKWLFTMIGPDGASYPNEAIFLTIEADRKVVIKHVNQPHFQLTITLEAFSGGTLLRWDQTFDDEVVAQSVRQIVEPANEQNLDRLSVVLGLSEG